ncbi:MAG TPA: hypothetical protein DEQ61_22585 [Streptomyces sp.]|nr:hypothetical protein [Streptomyces sp.]
MQQVALRRHTGRSEPELFQSGHQATQALLVRLDIGEDVQVGTGRRRRPSVLQTVQEHGSARR